MLELFSGSKQMATAFEKRGWEVFTVDYEAKYKPDLCIDIMRLLPDDIIDKFGKPDVIWSSPDCTCFSVASLRHYWYKGRPKNAKTRKAIELHKRALYLTTELASKYWFIENPRAMLRKQGFMAPYTRYTITYCQYGYFSQKPTDIWTNHPNPQFKPVCHPGDKCHDAAERGTRIGGIQKLHGSYARSLIPDQLCEHIVDICSTDLKVPVYQQSLIEVLQTN
jgi:hypothetical protein